MCFPDGSIQTQQRRLLRPDVDKKTLRRDLDVSATHTENAVFPAFCSAAVVSFLKYTRYRM